MALLSCIELLDVIYTKMQSTFAPMAKYIREETSERMNKQGINRTE